MRDIRGLGMLVALSVMGCGEAPGSLNQSEEAVRNGTTSSSYPEIGMVSTPTQLCTGTLIAKRWVLTAAHCISFSTANPGGYHFYAGSGSGTGGAGAVADTLFNFAPNGYFSNDSCPPNGCPVTPDHTGNNDIALIHLAGDVAPAAGVTLTTPRFNLPINGAGRIVPNVGDSMTIWGFGTSQNSWDYEIKRYMNWTYSTPSSLGYYQDGGWIRPGDSGGPVFSNASYGNPNISMPIFGVNSQGTGAAIETDEFGSVSYYVADICSTLKSFPHSPCRDGVPLTRLPTYCGYHSASSKVPSPYPEDIAGYICYDSYNGNPVQDPYCCTNWWDSQCIAEAQQAMSANDWSVCLAGP